MENSNNTWKYIVYETTNLVNNKIYVGMHKTANPDVFDSYLGNGIYATQPYTYEKAKTAFQCAVKKYGPKNFRRKTLAVFNTEQEASDLEEQIVNESFLERDDVYNMVLGGYAGCLISLRIKVYQYDINGNYINEYVSFAEAALKLNCDYTLISYAVRKKALAKGFFWNTDKVEKLDLSNYNLGLNHQIKTFVYNRDGSFYKEFKNQTQASKELGICTSSIRESRLLGRLAGNFYFSTIKAESYDKARKLYIETRPVFKYNSDGSFSKEYETQIEAELDNPGANITKSIKLKTPDFNGNLWSIEKLENYNKPRKKVNAKRKVGKYTLEGELVQTYDSATQAANENGTSVWKVLSGLNRTHKNHIYKYLEL